MSYSGLLSVLTCDNLTTVILDSEFVFNSIINSSDGDFAKNASQIWILKPLMDNHNDPYNFLNMNQNYYKLETESYYVYLKASNVGADLIIPEGVTKISNNVFKDNKTIKNVYVPASVAEIGDNAFGNSTLETITFSEGSQLTVIGVSTFGMCYSLKSIVIPASVKTLGQLAFSDCTLEHIVFEEGSQQSSGFSFSKL